MGSLTCYEQGMYIKDIAEKCSMHPKKLGILSYLGSSSWADVSTLGVVMMYLVTKHVFREVSPDVFANNAISSLLDSGKPVSAHLK